MELTRVLLVFCRVYETRSFASEGGRGEIYILDVPVAEVKQTIERYTKPDGNSAPHWKLQSAVSSEFKSIVEE